MRRFYDNYVKDQERMDEEGLLPVADGYPRATCAARPRRTCPAVARAKAGSESQGSVGGHDL